MIRYANYEDLDTIFNLMCELEYTKLDNRKFEMIYKYQIDSPMYHLFVYERNDEVVGFINTRIEGQLHHSENIAEILEFGVAKEHRSTGIGKLLLDETFNLAKKHRCQILEVACSKMRLKAHKYLEREDMINTHYKYTYEL